MQEPQLGGRQRTLVTTAGECPTSRHSQEAALVEMSPCPAGMVQAMEDGLVWPVSRLSLPKQTGKDCSNLWNPGTVELGLSSAFSVTIGAQPPGLQERE